MIWNLIEAASNTSASPLANVNILTDKTIFTPRIYLYIREFDYSTGAKDLTSHPLIDLFTWEISLINVHSTLVETFLKSFF